MGTGSEVRRPWYQSTSSNNPYNSNNNNDDNNNNNNNNNNKSNRVDKFSPNILLYEPGAVVCR